MLGGGATDEMTSGRGTGSDVVRSMISRSPMTGVSVHGAAPPLGVGSRASSKSTALSSAGDEVETASLLSLGAGPDGVAALSSDGGSSSSLRSTSSSRAASESVDSELLRDVVDCGAFDGDRLCGVGLGGEATSR